MLAPHYFQASLRGSLGAELRLAAAVFFCLFAVAGCGGRPAATDAPSNSQSRPVADAEKGLTAEEILRRSANAYKTAKTYSDEGELLVQFPNATEPSRFPFSVAFNRANSKLRISAYQVMLVSDGKRMRGFIEDTLSNNLDSQFLDAPAPAKLTPSTVIEDPEAAAVISQGAGGPPPVLEWLLADAPFGEILATPSRLKKLSSHEFEGRAYYRIQVDLRDAPEAQKSDELPQNARIVLWIDQENWLVGRLEYPGVAAPSPAEGSSERDIQITAELRGAQANGDVDDAQFTLTPTANAKVVSFFVPPPPPIPVERLGKPIEEFELTDLSGEKISSRDWAGKTAVLLFVRNHPASEEAARQLQRVYEALSSDSRFAFRVIANEPREVSNANIQGVLDRWEVTAPAARDFGVASGDRFGVTSLPTLVILDAEGRLQFTQSFGFGTLSIALPALCEQIAAGELIYERLLDVRKQYEERLAAAQSGEKPTALQLSPTPIAPAKPPKRLSLESAWDIPELKRATCLTIAPWEGQTALIVLEAPRTLHIYSLDGKLLQKKELPTPPNADVRILRASADAPQGNQQFVAFTPGGEAAYFFDRRFSLLGQFPPVGQPHEGVADAVLADLDGKDAVEGYVGFSALLGVQACELSGKRTWRNLAIPSVISLAAGPKNVAGWRKLYATDDRGRIFLLNQFGNHELVELQDREIHRLFSRSDAAAEEAATGDAIYCGISFLEKDELLAIGYDAEFDETWTYRLPSGVFVGPVQYAASVPAAGASDVLWIIAAPDGSIHFIGSQGQFEDSTCTGQRVTSLAAAVHEGKSLLIYGDEQGVHGRYIVLPASNSPE